MVRKRLRTQYNFPRSLKTKFNVDAVFSMEPLTFPGEGDSCDLDAGPASVTGLNCAGFGSSVVVTASFGLVAAAHLLRKLAAEANGTAAPQPEAVQADVAALS